MKRKIALLWLLVSIAFGVISAQNPMVIVPAASPAPATTTTTTTTAATRASDPNSLTSVIKLLQEMKSANAETLKKQEAVLQQLDDLQKAAEQMKAFSKRS